MTTSLAAASAVGVLRLGGAAADEILDRLAVAVAEDGERIAPFSRMFFAAPWPIRPTPMKPTPQSAARHVLPPSECRAAIACQERAWQVLSYVKGHTHRVGMKHLLSSPASTGGAR